jgi:predicted CXXCH cytochrome family protein
MVQPEAEAALCGSCHPGQSLGLNDHVSLVCSDCHASHAGHGQLLMRQPTVSQLCDSCHDPVGVSAASHDQRSSVPHAPPRHDEYANQDCSTCHITHR